MAKLKLTGTIKGAWADSDVLVLLIGTENAASLAASTPSGGSVAKRVTVKDARVGGSAGTTYRIDYEYEPDDKCATLPLGLAIEDPNGNRSSVDEDVVQIEDRPLGVGRPTATGTGNPNEATIAWTLSEDVQ